MRIIVLLMLLSIACQTEKVSITPEPTRTEFDRPSAEVLARPIMPCVPSWATVGWFFGYDSDSLSRTERVRDFLNELGLQELDGFNYSGGAAGDIDNSDKLLWEINYSVTVPLAGRVKRQVSIFIDPESCDMTLVKNK